MMKRQAMLPALAFGEANATTEHSIKAYSDRMATVVSALEYYDPLDSNGPFQSKTAAVAINGMRIVAGANTPVAVRVGDSPDLTLMIAMEGKSVSVCGQQEFVWRPHDAAMFFPRMGRGGRGDTRSTLNLDLNAHRLARTARAMLGMEPGAAIDLDIERARRVSLRHGSLSFDSLIRLLCQDIDTCRSDEAVLALLGVDENFYRVVVTMLRPDLFLGDSPGTLRGPDPQGLELVCQYIDAHLDTPLTLTLFEELSGMSRRGLQYAFLKRFGCSPMEWVRERRMERARERLEHASPGTTVTDVALDCGFTHLANFTRRYRIRFGEAPSETLGRRRA